MPSDPSVKHSIPLYTDYNLITVPGADGPFNFNLVYRDKQSGGHGVHKLVDSGLTRMPVGKWPNWVVRVVIRCVRLFTHISLDKYILSSWAT